MGVVKKLIIKLLCTVSLFSALPNFCMDGLEERDQEAEVVVLDDGRKWVKLRSLKDITQFKGKMVAGRSSIPAVIIDAGISKDTYYAFLDEASELPALVTYYFCSCGKRGHIYQTYGGCVTDRTCVMRLLTHHEMRSLVSYKKKLAKGCSLPNKGEFTLGNLLEEERQPYFRKQVRKTMWKWQRLLHIGKKDSGSTLYNVPKDIIDLLTKYTFNAQVSELMKKAKSDQKLDL
jgi:hypothetical protein